MPNENSLSLADALNDTFRVNFYQGYVQAAQQAVNDGVPLKGYFAWSLLGAPLVCQRARSRAVLPQPLVALCRGQASAHVCSKADLTAALLGALTAFAVSCHCVNETYDALRPMQSTLPTVL